MAVRTVSIGCVLAALAAPAWAQQSAGYRIQGAVLNAGGRPLDGSISGSASFILRPDALGEGAVSPPQTSPSFRLSAGFVQSFPAPGEVDNLILPGPTDLAWDPEPLAGHYHLYRAGPMAGPAGIAPVAGCWHDTPDTVSMDPAWPAPGQAFFYFVNAVNLIGVEGPDGVIAVPCP